MSQDGIHSNAGASRLCRISRSHESFFRPRAYIEVGEQSSVGIFRLR
jgi:hypothetical protein